MSLCEKVLCSLGTRWDESMMESSLSSDLLSLTDWNASGFWAIMNPPLCISLLTPLASLILPPPPPPDKRKINSTMKMWYHCNLMIGLTSAFSEWTIDRLSVKAALSDPQTASSCGSATVLPPVEDMAANANSCFHTSYLHMLKKLDMKCWHSSFTY